MSREPVEGWIWKTMTVNSSNEIGLYGLNREIQARRSTPEMQEGNILDFMLVTLSTKNYKNISLSSF